MTEQQPPTPPEQDVPASPEPASGAAPGPEAARPAPPAFAGPPPPGPYPYPPGPGTPGYVDPAFVAPPRPRVRWVNPDRRVHVAGAALVLALAFGGAGIAIGWAASDHPGHGPGDMRLVPRYYGGYLPEGPGQMHPRQLPRPAVPTPAPTSTH